LSGSFVLGYPGLGAVVADPALESAIKTATSRRAIFLIIGDASWGSEPKVLAGDGNLKTDGKD